MPTGTTAAGARTAAVSAAGCGSVRCPGSAAELRPGVRTALSTADTAAACGCPLLQKAVTRPTSARGVQPPPPSLPDLPAEPLAELLAHIGHGRPLQRQGLLGSQPAEPQPLDVAVSPGGDDRAGGHLRIHAKAGPGAVGPGAQLTGEVGHEHQ